EVTAQLHEDLVLEAVEGREVYVSALGLDHLIMVALAQQRGDAKASAGSNDRDKAKLGEWPIGSAQVAEIAIGQCRDRVGDRAEVVDDRITVDVQALLDKSGADHPGVIGQLQ